MKIIVFLILTFLASIGCSQSSLVDFYSFEMKRGDKLNLQEQMLEQGATALSGIVIHEKGIEHIEEGTLSKISKVRVNRETIFPVGALSIYPVILELHRLVKLGEISLTDPVSSYIPELHDKRKDQSKEFTLYDLLLFKRKLNGPYKPRGYKISDDIVIPEMILLKGNQDFPNGVKIIGNSNKTANSNCTVALLLQVLIERYHGRPLEQVIDSTIFQALDMKNSFYSYELEERAMKIAPTGHIKGKPLKNGYRRYGLLAAMGLWTTPSDYAKLIQHVFAAANGENNTIISEETAKNGISGIHEYRSLIFNYKDGRIYGGGNSKGYYTCIEGDPNTGFIQVMFANADLCWPLINYAMEQTESWLSPTGSTGQISLVVQDGDFELRRDLEINLKAICTSENLDLLVISPEQAPEQVTATPAIIYSNEYGWSLFGGKINTPEALRGFIRNSTSKTIAPISYTPNSIISKKNGKQTRGISLKLTAWQGDKINDISWGKDIVNAICEKWEGTENNNSNFLPTDRRYYLDIHPFSKGDTVFLSYAIFNQFNCISPIFRSFDSPITGHLYEKQELIDSIVEQSIVIIEEHSRNPIYGEALLPIKFATGYTNFVKSQFKTKNSVSSSLDHEPSLNRIWHRPHSINTSQPILQFNFPSPLERYLGEVHGLDGSLGVSEGLAYGLFTADLRSLTMGSRAFDKKVLNDYLLTKKFKTASFSFENQTLLLTWDQYSQQNILGQLSFLGKEVPLEVQARFYPNSLTSRLSVEIEFNLNIGDPFNLPGPDGPQAAKEQLEFFMQFDLETK